MENTAEIENYLKKLLEIVKIDPDILSAIIFGSYLHEQEFNDVDICLVLFPQSNSNPSKILIKYYAEFPSLFDFSIFSQLPLYIRERVQKEGKIILNKSFDALFDIYFQNIKDCNDFMPHYKVFLEAVKNG